MTSVKSEVSAPKIKYRYARIIIDISHEKVDYAFTYRIPDSLSDRIDVGVCVCIPFGKGNTVRTGYVVELTDHADYEESKIKEIKDIADAENGMDQRLVALSAWMKHRYGCTMIQALKTVLPVRKKVSAKEEKEVTLLVSSEQAVILRREAFLKHQSAKVRLFDALMGGATVRQKMLTGTLGISAATINSLAKQGLLKVETTREFRNPIRFGQTQNAEICLTDRQKEIADDYLSHYDAGNRQPALLHGITGSGKTEVYMEIIDGILQRGKEVIVLIPEIALTYQTVRRFYRRFGEKISILNSRLSAGERYDQIERVKKGEVKIMIGPRSALFTPFPNPGLILIDEEHETSYKSETMPRYHAREVAAKICEMTGAGLFLGSATPSLDSYFQAEKGRYRLYRLTERIGEAVLPAVQIVDLRKELAQGNFSMFSKALENAMDVTLARGEQIMLFLNRRGIAGFVSCKSCGEVLKCPHCDVSLSEHRSKMICHYCGYETAKVKTCPSCGSPYIYGMKAGTQQVEELLQKRYPKAKILRMDADTTRKKEDYDTILAAFSQHEADILVGTQMIVKGHDFPEVTLVGVLAADQSLFASDYTAPERTFQLLTQAVGRAGRADKKGQAVIQTYQPDHFAIQKAAAQDYDGFYEEEIGDREMLSFPPAGHLLAVLISGEDEERTRIFAAWLAGHLRKSLNEQDDEKNAVRRQPQVLGPAPAGIGKIKDQYRFVIYVKSENLEELIRAKDVMTEKVEYAGRQAEPFLVTYDFDPMSGY